MDFLNKKGHEAVRIEDEKRHLYESYATVTKLFWKTAPRQFLFAAVIFSFLAGAETALGVFRVIEHKGSWFVSFFIAACCITGSYRSAIRVTTPGGSAEKCGQMIPSKPAV
jgi:hypothetical protein